MNLWTLLISKGLPWQTTETIYVFPYGQYPSLTLFPSFCSLVLYFHNLSCHSLIFVLLRLWVSLFLPNNAHVSWLLFITCHVVVVVVFFSHHSYVFFWCWLNFPLIHANAAPEYQTVTEQQWEMWSYLPYWLHNLFFIHFQNYIMDVHSSFIKSMNNLNIYPPQEQLTWNN